MSHLQRLLSTTKGLETFVLFLQFQITKFSVIYTELDHPLIYLKEQTSTAHSDVAKYRGLLRSAWLIIWFPVPFRGREMLPNLLDELKTV